MKTAYNPKIVTAFFAEFGIPEPQYEYRFHPTRRWRFDIAFIDEKLAVEINGGIFTGGRHVRGPALQREYEKLSTAAMLGWRVMIFQPLDIMKTDTANMIKHAIDYRVDG